MATDLRRVYTVGHSTRSVHELIALLREPGVQVVADVRRWPVSSRYPHFNAEPLEAALGAAGLAYGHLGKALGGYRDGGYEAHMETAEFAEGMRTLEQAATTHTVAVL